MERFTSGSGSFLAPDGTRLACHRAPGSGPPLICLPGGPMQSSAYLAELPLPATVRLDPRGTGDSATPADPATYRCDRQLPDLEALRRHLALDTIDLLAHSGGATLALLYAAAHPARIRRLILVAPSPRPIGRPIPDARRREIALQSRDEPWFPAAYAALERLWSGTATPADGAAITPFIYGRWDPATQDHAARGAAATNTEAAAAFYHPDAFDPAALRAALSALEAPVLLIAGSRDIQLPDPHTYTDNARVAVLPGGGHYPWRDDPAWFARTVLAS